MDSRRDFIRKIATVLGMAAIDQEVFNKPVQAKPMTLDARSTVYRAVNGKPDENLIKVTELMGGIEKVIGEDDVVVIKPNAQWWNQGAPNLSALKTFVELISNRPGGFKGEVVIAENCHRGLEPWKSIYSSWASRFDLNSDVKNISNMNDLSEQLKKKYADKFSTCHWTDIEVGAKRVGAPDGGPGYVYCDGTRGVPLVDFGNGLSGKDSRSTIMTYPIWITDKGTVVDFKNGIWEKGGYTGQPMKFINFAALNHHSTYCGATSAVKNYLGITDLSGGPDPKDKGKLTEKYFNFHSFPLNKWAQGPAPGMIGAEVGFFMKAIRKADLNITTAEWVGLASRTVPPVARTRAVLASTDPVALDYHAFKYVLYPNSGFSVHNPDHAITPIRQDLSKCAEQGGGVFDEKYVKVASYDFLTKKIQRDEDLVVQAEKQWGSNPKAILKYMYLRYMA